MSMMDTLPLEVRRNIYELDNTYREVLNESLKFIEHVVPVCTCSGEFRWKCINTCPKHNPSAYSDDYRDYDYIPFESHPDYTPLSRYLRKKNPWRIYWLMLYSITTWMRKSSEWLIIRRAHNSFKRCQLKKEYLQRFMDMRDNQRKLVA